MALNYPGPWQVRLYYTTSPTGFLPMQHVINFNVDVDGTPSVGDTFSDIDLKRHPGTSVSLFSWCNDMVLLFRDFHNSTDTVIDQAELWKFDAGTFEATYYATQSYSQAGLSATTNKIVTATLYMFRTEEGGIMKIQVMEDIYPGNFRVPYATMGTEGQDWVDFILDATDGPVILGRDTSPAIAFLGSLSSQNEALFKKRYR